MSKIRNSKSLMHVLAHHAKALEPLVGWLATGILLELQPLGWEVVQVKTGAQSYKLVRGPKEFHFRYDAPKGIAVKDGWYGKVIFRIASRRDVAKFVQMVTAIP